MKFNLICKNAGKPETWKEDYNKDIDDIEKYCKDIIESFNNTLRPGEEKREYVGFEIVKDKKIKPDNEVEIIIQKHYERKYGDTSEK